MLEKMDDINQHCNLPHPGAQPRQAVDVIKEVLFFEKEQKLKDQLRRGNCVLKKLRQCREDDEEDDQVLYFFCQVDMKLVSRVLQMSKLTTDQLVWCHNKLSKVSFVSARWPDCVETFIKEQFKKFHTLF